MVNDVFWVVGSCATFLLFLLVFENILSYVLMSLDTYKSELFTGILGTIAFVIVKSINLYKMPEGTMAFKITSIVLMSLMGICVTVIFIKKRIKPQLTTLEIVRNKFEKHKFVYNQVLSISSILVNGCFLFIAFRLVE